MDFGKSYERLRDGLLNNKRICEPNRKLFKKFFDFEEYKLKRINGSPVIDDSSYKTLLGYIQKLRNINKWFKNKPLKQLTKKDIKKVYDDLEDGKIKNNRGTEFKDKSGYYTKIFRGKLFRLAGKSEQAKEIMEFYKRGDRNVVKFIEEETFRKIVSVVNTPNQKLLCWLGFDIGENIFSLLQLKKKNCTRGINTDTKEAEYVINLPKEILKRSRTPRSELTNYKETAGFLDIVLKDLEEDDKLFSFKLRQAQKFLDRAVKLVGAKCIPNGEKVTWMILRKSMACDLLRKKWTTDEIKSRLGHKPSSDVLDSYVTYLALEKHQPKRKIYNNTLDKIQEELESKRQREKLLISRVDNQKAEFDMLKESVKKLLEVASSQNLIKLKI